MKKQISLALALVMLVCSIFVGNTTALASTKIDEAMEVTKGETLEFKTTYDRSLLYRAAHCWLSFTPDKTTAYSLAVTVDNGDESMLISAVFNDKVGASKLDTNSQLEPIGFIFPEDEESSDLNAIYNLTAGHTYYIDVIALNFEDEKAEPAGTMTITTHTHTYESYCSTADTEFDGEMGEMCTTCGKTRNVKAIYQIKSIALSYTTSAYSGKNKTPAVIIKDRKGNQLVKGTDYTLTYPKNRSAVGKYAVQIKFKGKYSGITKKYFTIKPSKVEINSITPSKKAITVKWTKKTAQVTGYQIQYSVKKDFSVKKSITLSNKNAVAKRIASLSGGKRYYVRIRTYKTVKDKNYYSDWSKVKSAIAKK